MRRRRGRPRGLTVALLAGAGVGVVGVGIALLVASAWMTPAPSSDGAASAPASVTARTDPPPGDGASARDDGTAPAAPPLTFYRELTAPLPRAPGGEPRGPLDGRAEARPPAPGPDPRSHEAVERATATLPPRSTRPEPAATSGPAVAGEPRRFTVQVAAFLVPASAEALRDRLSAAGHDAYVVRAEGAEGVRYRVRVGAFTTREEARELADRLRTERGQPTYVTTR